MIQCVRLTFILLVVLILAARITEANAQCGGSGQLIDHLNSGTEFLLCFEQNYVVERDAGDDGYLEIYLATLDQPSTVTITSNRYPRMNRVFNLAPRSAKTYRITVDTIQYHASQRTLDTAADLWITSHEQPDGRVVRVSATTPIVCYGMNHKQSTTDAFLALPQQTAGTEYRIMSYPNSELLGFNNTRMPSQFAVAAFDDKTDVTIVPKALTSGGHVAGVPFTVTINAGECVQVQADGLLQGGDLTGTEVRATHPVAVYGSHARAEVPVGYTQPDGLTSRDHLTEALPPVGVWGKAFVLSAFDIDNAGHKRPEGDLMRILALNDNTQVAVNGNLWLTLNHDEFADSLIHGPIIVESTGPVMLAELSHTSTIDGDQGDPSMAIVPSIDQTYSDYTFFASSDPAFTLQKVIIATDMRSAVSDSNANFSTIVVDNSTLLPSIFFPPLATSVGGRRFAITELGVEPGAHTLRTARTPDQGFTILMYGFGQVDSYAYTAGILLKPLRALMGSSLPLSAGRNHSNEITIRNITNENVYLDSAVVSVENSDYRQYGIHVSEKVAFDIGRLPIGQSCTVHLTTDKPLNNVVRGTVKVYGYTPKWMGLEPAEIPFTLYPEAFASVSNSKASALSLQNYPNPFSSSTAISVMLPERADLTVKVYDQLGRVVRVVAAGEYPQGVTTLQFDRAELAAGVYVCEVRSNKLELQERTSIVVVN